MIVQDKMVSNGMFSKAGRLSLEMFTMLQEKETVMTGQKKKISNEYINSYKNEQLQQQQQNQYHRSLRPAQKVQSQDFKQKEKQPFTKNVSRDHIYKIMENQISNNQKFGMYSPKYHYVFNKSPLYEDNEFEDYNKRRIINYRQKLHNEHMQKIVYKRKPNLHQSLGLNPNKSINHIPNSSILQNASLVVNDANHNLAQSMVQQTQDIEQVNKSVMSKQGQSPTRKNKLLNQSISDPNFRPLLGIDFDKPKRKVQGPIRFSKYAAAQDFTLH